MIFKFRLIYTYICIGVLVRTAFRLCYATVRNSTAIWLACTLIQLRFALKNLSKQSSEQLTLSHIACLPIGNLKINTI